MYNISLTKLQGSELAGFLKQLPLEKAGTVDSLSLIQNSVKDLLEQNKPYVDALLDFQKKQIEIVKPINEELRALQFKKFAAEGADAKRLEEEINLRAQIGQEKVSELSLEAAEVVEAHSKEEIVLTLSDDKFDKVKEMFNLPTEIQQGGEKKALALLVFKDMAVCAAIGDALKNAVKI